MADETIIVEVILETKNQIENANRLRTAIDELKVTQDNLRKNGEANTVQFEANAAALRDLQTQYRQTTKDIDNTNKQIQAETGSIAANRAELAKLTAEYIKSAKPTGEQTARIKALSDRLKEQEKAVGDTRRNVGNYGDALKGLGSALPGVGKGMDTFNKISASNPIGLVVLAVVSLVDIFKKFQPVVDAISVGMAIMNNIFDVVQNTIAKVFEGITQILSGNFAQGFDTIGTAVGGVGDQFAQAAAEGIRYAETLKEIEDLNARNAVFFAQQEKQIAILSRSLRDRTKSEQDRLKIADEITKVENSRFQKEKEISDLNAKNERIALGNALLRKGVTLEEIKNTEDIVKLAQDRAVSDDLINKYVEARVQSINKETESETRLEAIQVRRNQILEAGEAKRLKAEEDRKKAAEDAIKAAEKTKKELEGFRKAEDDFTELQKKEAEKRKKEAEDIAKAIVDARQKEYDDSLRFNKEYYSQLELNAKNAFIAGTTTEREYNAELTRIKDAQLAQQVQIQKDYGEITVETEKEIADRTIKTKEDEAARSKAIKEAEFAAAQGLAESLIGLGNSLAMNSKNAAEIQKGIAAFQIALDSAKAIANIVELATAPTADNVATGGLAVPFKIAALSATVLANIARANAILNSASFYEGGLYSEEGGHTGSGSPFAESRRLGKKPYVYHKEEYIVPRKVLARPIVASFIDSVVEPMRKGLPASGLSGMIDGGYSANAIRNEVTASLQTTQFEKALSKMRPQVSVTEINTVQNKVAVLDSMSTL